MTEPDVTLTDYALAVECATLTLLTLRWRMSDRRMRGAWAVLFASIAVSSVAGGTVHGFYKDETTTGYTILWTTTLLVLGVTATALWFVASYTTVSSNVGVWMRRAAAAILAAYALVVIFVVRKFYVAILVYLPATLFLLGALVVRRVRHSDSRTTLAITALVLTLVGAVVQQARIALHPVYFNHNALYHLIQFVALILLYIGGKRLSGGSVPVAPSAWRRAAEPPPARP